MVGDQAGRERRASAYLQSLAVDQYARIQGAVGHEGTGKTRHDGRTIRWPGIDFAFVYGIGDPVDWPDNLIECTDYHELPPEQLLLPPGEEAEDEL